MGARLNATMGAMPIPASPSGPGVTSTVMALFRQVHEQLRHELHGLDHDAVNWVPTSGANSIATIVTHLVASEAETLRCVAGIKGGRDREAEFVARGATMPEVLQLIDGADDLVTALEPRIDGSRLEAMVTLPTLPSDQVRSGLTWLVGNYGHACEHVGHVQLTKQLHRQGTTSA